jgi:hypothetical protein
MQNSRQDLSNHHRRSHLWWALAILFALGLFSTQFQASWAQPHQNDLRQTINTPVATPTSGPTSTPSPTAAPGVHRVLLQEGRDGYVGTADTYIRAYTPWVASALDGGLRVKGAEDSTLIRFDLQSHLPPGAHIMAAELLFHVDVPAFTVVRALDVSAFRVLRPWQPTGVSWNYQQIAGQVRWDQAGCNGVGVDRVGDADDTITLLQRDVFRGFNVTQSVRHWQQHPQENFGWLIAGVSASTGSFTLASSRNQNLHQRPVLRIDYTLGGVSPTATQTLDPGVTATATSSPTPSTPTATPMPTTVALNVVQDCYIDEWEPTLPHNHGTLICRTNGVRKVLVQFDLSTLPPHAVVTSAKLRLTTVDAGANLIYVHAYRLLTCWQENSATWQQARTGQSWAAAGASASGVDYAPTSLDRVAVDTRNKTYEWDVTAAAQAWMQGGQENCGLILVGDAGPQLQWGFVASEHSSSIKVPQLLVEYAVVPPTATPTATPTASSTPSATLTPTATPSSTVTPTGSGIVALVFADANRNGQRDVGEGGVPGVRVQLLNDARQPLDERVTGSDGEVAFTGLLPGWYRVQVQPSLGFQPTTAEQVRVYVSGSIITVPFGGYSRHTITLPLIIKTLSYK